MSLKHRSRYGPDMMDGLPESGMGVRSRQEPGTIKSMVQSKHKVRKPGWHTEVWACADPGLQEKWSL